MESDPESIVENDLDKNRHKQIVLSVSIYNV